MGKKNYYFLNSLKDLVNNMTREHLVATDIPSHCLSILITNALICTAITSRLGYCKGILIPQGL